MKWLLIVLAACGSHAEPKVQPKPQPTIEPAVEPNVAPKVVARPGRGQIAVGMGYGCVRMPNATLTCWGRSYPQTPTRVDGVSDVAFVSAAQGTNCAVTTHGDVFCADDGPMQKKTGISEAVELAADPDAFVTCARRKDGTVACWSDFDKGSVHDAPGVTGALEIAVAGATACMRDAKGVACWHTNDPAAKLTRITAADGATSLGGGRFLFAAVRAGKPPFAWHEDDYRELKLPKLADDVMQLAIGGDDACALGKSMQCWPWDAPAQLHTIPKVDGALEVAVGMSLACARLPDRVMCWGAGNELGTGAPVNTDTPVDVAGVTDATHLVVGGDRTCVRRASGRIACWGSRAYGRTDPAPVDERGDDGKFDCARGFGDHCPKSPKREWSGGYQRGSWLCKKTTKVTCEETFAERHGDPSSGPEDSWGNLDNVRDIAMPTNQTEQVCVASATGSVSCFGPFDGATNATPIDGVTDVIQLAAVGEDVCALERAGTVKCWKTGAPRAVPNITDAVELAGGDLNGCVRHKAGTVSCWGYRIVLGDNFDVHQVDPIVVVKL